MLRPRRTRPRPAEAQTNVSTGTPGTAARAAAAMSSSSVFVNGGHARLHRLARDRVDLNEREAAAGVHDLRETARPCRDLVSRRRLAAKAQEHGLNDDRMPLRGLGEIREDPLEGNRAPRDRLVETFRAGIELDPERAAPRLEEVVRLAHLAAREARAVRDEDERNVPESGRVAHVEESPREREEAAKRGRLAVAREGDVAHRIGRWTTRPDAGRELLRELARHVVDRDRGPPRSLRDLPAVDDLAVDAVEVARLLRVEVDADRDPARPARPHDIDVAVLSARARVEGREMRSRPREAFSPPRPPPSSGILLRTSHADQDRPARSEGWGSRSPTSAEISTVRARKGGRAGAALPARPGSPRARRRSIGGTPCATPDFSPSRFSLSASAPRPRTSLPPRSRRRRPSRSRRATASGSTSSCLRAERRSGRGSSTRSERTRRASSSSSTRSSASPTGFAPSRTSSRKTASSPSPPTSCRARARAAAGRNRRRAATTSSSSSGPSRRRRRTRA